MYTCIMLYAGLALCWLGGGLEVGGGWRGGRRGAKRGIEEKESIGNPIGPSNRAMWVDTGWVLIGFGGWWGVIQ